MAASTRRRATNRPTLALEGAQWAAGREMVAGIDEAGRGPLAGPVAAAAVVLPPGASFPWLGQVHDSKLLAPAQRLALAPLIRRDALAVGLGWAAATEIDQAGIVESTRRAMLRAVAALPRAPHSLLIDALLLPACPLPQRAIIHGDRLCLSIACASIVAKVERDGLMMRAEEDYPGYGFARHKGYPTRQHRQALAALGPCPLHRRSFRPVREGWPPATPPGPPPRQRLGALGERLAAEHLQALGYEIVQRGFRCPEGQIDIIARRGDLLAFVEVKARRSQAMGAPEEGVGPRQRRRLLQAAEVYLAAHPEAPPQCRIDLVALEWAGGRLARLEHIEGAIDAL